MKNLIYKIIFLVPVLMAVVVPVMAQSAPPVATPIDGGLSLLLAAGGAYGIKKIRDYRKSN